jgi:hypothetical protein
MDEQGKQSLPAATDPTHANMLGELYPEVGWLYHNWNTNVELHAALQCNFPPPQTEAMVLQPFKGEEYH